MPGKKFWILTSDKSYRRESGITVNWKFKNDKNQKSKCYTDDKQTFLTKKDNGMKMDFSWNISAEKYEALYGWAIDARKQAFA